jgi:SurA-like protein
VNIQRNRIAVIVVAAVAVLFGLVGVAYTAHLGPWTAPKPPDHGRVIARVDGNPIYFEFARARVSGLTSVHGSLADTMGDDWPDRILDSLVDDQLIQAEAARLGIVVASDELDAHIANLRSQFPSADAFDEWLRTQRMDLAELQRRITLQTLGARVYEAVTKDVSISTEQIRDYYRSHPSKFRMTDGTRTPLFDVKDEIVQKLLPDAQDEAFGSWLGERRSEASVVIVDPDWWKDLT